MKNPLTINTSAAVQHPEDMLYIGREVFTVTQPRPGYQAPESTLPISKVYAPIQINLNGIARQRTGETLHFSIEHSQQDSANPDVAGWERGLNSRRMDKHPTLARPTSLSVDERIDEDFKAVMSTSLGTGFENSPTLAGNFVEHNGIVHNNKSLQSVYSPQERNKPAAWENSSVLAEHPNKQAILDAMKESQPANRNITCNSELVDVVLHKMVEGEDFGITYQAFNPNLAEGINLPSDSTYDKIAGHESNISASVFHVSRLAHWRGENPIDGINTFVFDPAKYQKHVIVCKLDRSIRMLGIDTKETHRACDRKRKSLNADNTDRVKKEAVLERRMVELASIKYISVPRRHELRMEAIAASKTPRTLRRKHVKIVSVTATKASQPKRYPVLPRIEHNVIKPILSLKGE